VRDADGFDECYRATSRRLLSYTYALTGDWAQAQDLVQEAYMRAWRQWGRISEYEDVEAWLRLVVSRLATDAWRRLGRWRRAMRLLGTSDDAQPPSESAVLVARALRDLPPSPEGGDLRMSDLGDAFAQIHDEAQRRVLPAAADLRVRSEKRARRRAAVGTLAVVGLATAAVIGILPLVNGQAAPPPQVGSSSTPTSPPPTLPTPDPSASTSTGTTSPRCIDNYPGKIPDTVFLADNLAENALCFRTRAALPGEETWETHDRLPEACLTPAHPSDAMILDRRGIEGSFDDGAGVGSPAISKYSHTVTQYSGTGAADYLAEVRNAVSQCNKYTRKNWQYDYAIVSGAPLGDESIMLTVKQTYLGVPEGFPKEATFRISVVQVGSNVSVLFDWGWEGSPSLTPALNQLMARAAGKLATL
jgi:RNA polymerase sigma-70 factor (ECF subfamily)